MWAAVARFIASRPALVDWLIRRAQRTPYLHIYGSDGSLYMGRWWLVKERAWLPFSVRIHHIVRPDLDHHLHDHPFDFRSIVLRGGYVEENVFGSFRTVSVGDTYDSRAERFHRIDSLLDGGAWTLFVMGRRRNQWGFLVDGHKVYWRTYLGVTESEGGEA